MIGGYTALTATQMRLPYLLAVPVAVLITMLIGAIVEILIIRRLYGRIFDTMLATWGLSMVFYQLAVLTFGTVTPGIGVPQFSFKIGKYSLAGYPLLMIAVAICMALFVYFLMTRTVYGMKARAPFRSLKWRKRSGLKPSGSIR